MAVFNCMYPIVAGKEELARSFAAELAGPRREEFDALQARGDVTRETWTVQETPQGSLILIWSEGDIEKAFTALATDDDAFTQWFRARVLEISGFDLTAPDDGPMPLVILDWDARQGARR